VSKYQNSGKAGIFIVTSFLVYPFDIVQTDQLISLNTKIKEKRKKEKEIVSLPLEKKTLEFNIDEIYQDNTTIFKRNYFLALLKQLKSRNKNQSSIVNHINK